MIKPSARLQRLQAQVERALAGYLKGSEPSLVRLDEAMRYSVLGGGKRYRPLLCLAATEALGGDIRKAMPVACAVEMIHSYSLVHDDLPAMDNANERRGRASCHRKYGEATAILVGDALLTRAFEVLATDGTPNGLQIIRVIGEAAGVNGLVGGQLLDLREGMSIGGRGAKGVAQQLQDIAMRKTAALITASVVAGGLAGGARPAAVRSLREYGLRIGLAFQALDDVHDNDGLAAASDPARLRAWSFELIGQAKAAVTRSFKQRAAALIELADWLQKIGS